VRRVLPVIIAIAVFVAAGIAWIVADRRAARHAFDEFSTANTSDEGLSLAARYLARQNRSVRRLTRPLGSQRIDPNAVLFRVTPVLPFFGLPENFEDLGQKKKNDPKKRKLARPILNDHEAAWVRGGGRMVLAAFANVGSLETRGFHTPKAKKVFPLWRGVDWFTLPEKRGFAPESLPPRMHAVYTNGQYVIVARERIGAGELFVVAIPELLQNRHLGSGNSLELLLALAPAGRRIYFDEIIHGIVGDDGPLALMKQWRLGPFLMLVLATAALLFWRNGRRVGPPEDDHRETRSEAVDLVQSLGALYKGATTDAEALALYHDALVRAVAMQSGLRGDALHRRVGDLTGGIVPPTGRIAPADFQQHLTILNDAFQKLAAAKTLAKGAA
jgi:hypothetical protein